MDAVGFYLPSPTERPKDFLVNLFKESLCARAFKVRHDEHKGAVTFFRIFSGDLQKVSNNLLNILMNTKLKFNKSDDIIFVGSKVI